MNLPEREEKILEFWEREKIFEKSLEKTQKGKHFVFYEGPPTANAAPGIHHVEARAFKDVIPRYKTMRGFLVPRKAGWDTHGLPVELAVEKELGLKTKRDIEKYGIEKFNKKCRESVWRYKKEWERLTKRIGFWLDLKHPYITYETPYVETLWWIIKEFWKNEFLYKDFKIIPWCPRCQTGLSSHELGQPGAYKKIKENSIFVKFKIKDRANEYLLIWTTTPWTLPANVAIAVNTKIEYTKWKVTDRDGTYFLWSAAVPQIEPRDTAEVSEKASGKSLVGLAYEPLFRISEEYSLGNKPDHTVIAGDFVSTEDGTGMVHIAPAYGDEDMAVMKKLYGATYPILHTVNPDGSMKRAIIGDGKFVKDADADVIENLKNRNLLYKIKPYEHDYPHCWRCSTPLLYYARNSWWLKTTKAKEKLIKNNQTIDWIPEHIKKGRFGEFLSELRDWAFSRERYWGTPLPVWECLGCQKTEAIGSVAELAMRAPWSGNTYFSMRHGESETQLLGIVADSNSKYHLTEKGKLRVRKVAQSLKKEKVDIIFYSDALRTTETAKIVSSVLGVRQVVKDPRLREINTGTFDGRSPREYHGFFSSREEYFTKPPPKGESLNDLKRRLMGFMRDIEAKYRGKKILIISHEYPIWILEGASLGLDQNGIINLHGRGKDYIGLAEARKFVFRNLPRDESGEVNLHRPFVDEFGLVCKTCDGEVKRVKDVVDVWFDSGAMPFAQANFPFAFAQIQNSQFKIQNSRKLLYPADFIAEAVDQTRGWFYTLLAVATLLGKKAPYRHVISLGHVLDKNGQKMSKSKGNVVDPWEMIKKYGADTIRWYFFTVNPPGEPKHFDEKDLQNKLRGTLANFWNCLVFFKTYTNKTTNYPPAPRLRRAGKLQTTNSRNVLDRWILARLKVVVSEVTKRLDRYDVVGAARIIESFLVDDFSNWYLRRSRRRFQRPETKFEKNEAAGTTAYILVTLAKLFAPFTPFLADIVWGGLKKHLPLREPSVHLTEWPKLRRADAREKKLLEEMADVRKITAIALAERARAGIKVRQPLASLQILNSKFKILKDRGLLELIKDEVNVKDIIGGEEIKLDTEITPELREEGWIREVVRNVQEMRKDLGLRPIHKIRLQFVADPDFSNVLDRWRKFIGAETGAKTLQAGGKKIFSAERELSFDGHEVWLGIRKV